MARKYLTKTLPYTAEDLKAAEEWMDEVGFEAGMIDTEDFPAILETLANAFARHVEKEKAK